MPEIDGTATQSELDGATIGSEAEGAAALGLDPDSSEEDLGAEGETSEEEDPKDKGDGDEEEGKEGEAESDDEGEDEGSEKEEPETLESLKTKLETTEKRRRDGDALISKQADTIAKLKASVIAGSAKKPGETGAGADADYEKFYPDEAQEIKLLREEGKNVEAAILENRLATTIQADQDRAEKEVRQGILTETAETLKLKDFSKYRDEVATAARNIPLREFADRPGQWTRLFYNAAIGKDFIEAQKKNSPKKPAGPASSHIGAGSHKSTGKAGQPKSDAEQAEAEILGAGGSHSIFG